ncbi:MAG TPA: hypothetical protein PLE77_06945 [Kiritimatiellia bacterium]|nr:hypothetical protein [Kiritimatiellia bacterium]
MRAVSMLVVLLVVAGALSASAFTEPTMDQLKAAAADPVTVSNLIQGATAEEAAAVVAGVIQEIDKLSISMEEKQQRTATVLAQLQKEMGEDMALAMGIVMASQINLDLLPAVGALGVSPEGFALPIAQPLAPPVAPRYEGQ